MMRSMQKDRETTRWHAEDLRISNSNIYCLIGIAESILSLCIEGAKANAILRKAGIVSSRAVRRIITKWQ